MERRSRYAAGLAAALNRVLADPALAARLADAARVHATAYDIERTTRRLEAVYARALD